MKYSIHFLQVLLSIAFIFSITACHVSVEDKTPAFNQAAHEKSFKETLQKHLDAVSNKDLATLESTLSPEGTLHFMLDQRETSHQTKDFISFHEEWFKNKNWTFETNITNTEVGPKYGLAITEIIYREPERNGKPYFNRMAVSYVLKFIDETWYVIKDHATSIEKAK